MEVTKVRSGLLYFKTLMLEVASTREELGGCIVEGR